MPRGWPLKPGGKMEPLQKRSWGKESLVPNGSEKGQRDRKSHRQLGWMSARAAITRYHRCGCFNNRNAFPQSGGWKSKVKVSEGRFPPRPPSLPCRWLFFPLRLHMIFPPCTNLLQGLQSYRIRASPWDFTLP